MKKINFILTIIAILTFFTACNSSDDSSSKTLKKEVKICPECNMPVEKSNIFKASLLTNGTTEYFDDIGCMILWCHEKNLNMKEAKVFCKDTKRYIDAKDAYFKIGEKTPMLYGFAAYEKKIDGSTSFEVVTIKMLRGENMRNPRIRKQILGH
ncbi:MAG: copper chaperone NosL [Sulfurimonas sp.]|jgi:copper chaperone NosL